MILVFPWLPEVYLAEVIKVYVFALFLSIILCQLGGACACILKERRYRIHTHQRLIVVSIYVPLQPFVIGRTSWLGKLSNSRKQLLLLP